MLVRPADVPKVADARDAVVMRPLVTAAEHGPYLSITLVELRGRHRRLRTDRSTRAYCILDGRATFSVGEDAPFVADAGDVVVVPAGTDYAFEGDMRYLVVNGPAFVEGDDVYDHAS